MLRRLMNKKVLIGLLGILTLSAASSQMMTTLAEEDRFVTWGEGAKENEVRVGITLSARDTVQKAETFQIQLGISSDMAVKDENIRFLYDREIEQDPLITVKEYRYNEDNHTLTFYLSGKENLLKKDLMLNLGTITVTADSDVTLSIVEEGCKAVDENFAEQPFTWFGSREDYTVKQDTADDETPPEETTPEETTPDETIPDENVPEEKTEREDSSNSVWKDPEETGGTWKAKDGIWNFEKEDGTYAQSEWIKAGGEWYWIGADGRMITGWIHLNNVWYFCGPSGAMKTGWVNTGGHWFYFNPSGAMKTGWVLEKGYWYYMGDSGAMKTGWIQAEGKWYYLDESGHMLADTVTPDGGRVDKNGVRID